MKRGRPKRVTHSRLMKAIEGSNGIIEVIAGRLGVTRQSIHRALKEDAEAREFLENEADTILDIAEVVVFDAIKNRDVNTAKWYLGTKGGRRGYNNSIKIDTDKDSKVVLNFIDSEGSAVGSNTKS